jgi:hypothetical protein
MSKNRRDIVLLISFFVVETGLPLGWAHQEGWITRLVFWERRGIWYDLGVLALAELALFALCLWAISRGEFRWRCEGVITGIYIMILLLIVLPVLIPNHGESGRSRSVLLSLSHAPCVPEIFSRGRSE